jgi:hypothetical protein
MRERGECRGKKPFRHASLPPCLPASLTASFSLSLCPYVHTGINRQTDRHTPSHRHAGINRKTNRHTNPFAFDKAHINWVVLMEERGFLREEAVQIWAPLYMYIYALCSVVCVSVDGAV